MGALEGITGAPLPGGSVRDFGSGRYLGSGRGCGIVGGA